MAIRFYNTLTRKKEEFVPLVPGEVRMYSCGPTVYSYVHIGNLRTFMFADLVRRHLRYRGFDVTHVMNITDVEDKIIRTCRETGESRASLTARFTQAFFEDIETLGIERPDACPRATDHIDDMVDLIKTLRDKGHTYDSNGSVYFRLKTFEHYGRLSGFDLDSLQDGGSGRVDSDEYETEDARDFALWKAYTEEDGDVYWETELGKGRPGWHIECSAMSMKALGPTFDIHCGAVDLIFPHHENEIAQSEAATGKPFVRYWLHAAHLNIDGRKISKSLGNIITLRRLLEDGYDPMAIRWALRATHYRQPSNFSKESIRSAKESLRRIRDFRRRLDDVTGPGADLVEETAACERAFGEALDDDLNISAALAAVFEFVRDTNKRLDQDAVSASGAANALALLDRLDEVVGLFGPAGEEAVPESVLARIEERQRARRDKDFDRADALRDELAAEGWIIEDTPTGPRAKRA